MNKNEEIIQKIENNINYVFKNKSLLAEAITHKSYANEYMIKSNERLEFLGDSILNFVIAEELFLFHKINEGEMSKKRAYIVCEDSLNEIGLKLKIDLYIRLGHSAARRSVKSIIADCVEAIIGAIYLDSDLATVKKIILDFMREKIEESKSKTFLSDYKSKLQEYVQSKGIVDIKYNTIKETGPDHNKSFEVELKIRNERISIGKGKSKKLAEADAARNALIKFEEIENK